MRAGKVRAFGSSAFPAAARLGMGVLTWSPLASGFLSGKVRRGQDVDLTTGRAALAPFRFDPALPENGPKFDALEQLVEVADGLGATLPEPAVAFAAAHPAVTSVSVGPLTMAQVEATLAGAALELDDATPDRIDEIVPPGTDPYRADGAWLPPVLADARLRRRPVGERAAA